MGTTRRVRNRAVLAVAALVATACGGAEVDELIPSADPQDATGDADEPPGSSDDATAAADDAAAADDLDGAASRSADDHADGAAEGSGDDSDAASAAEVEDDEPGVAVCTSDDTQLSPGVPDAATRVEQASGDLTGDGIDDTVATYAIGEGDDAVFLLRVETATGYVVEASLDDAAAMAPVGPLGVADVGPAQGVAMVVEASGAAGVNVALWGLHDHGEGACALRPVTVPDHTVERTFGVGGTTGHASGLRCEDVSGDGGDELVVVTAERADDGYDWRETAWRWPGAGALEHVATDEGSVAELEELDGGLGLGCPGVEAP